MTTEDEARVSTAEDAGTVTITGAGSLTFLNATEFGEKLSDASVNADSVVVDLREADFIDTKIVQDMGKAAVALMNRNKRLKVLIVGGAYPLRVLRVTALDSLMDIEAGGG